jgi:hypothetical protein
MVAHVWQVSDLPPSSRILRTAQLRIHSRWAGRYDGWVRSFLSRPIRSQGHSAGEAVGLLRISDGYVRSPHRSSSFRTVSLVDCCARSLEGERPGRPNGPEVAQFTDDLWRTLNRCRAAQPQRRPIITAVLECLERVLRAVRALSRDIGRSTGTDEGDWDFSNDSPRVVSAFSFRCFVALSRNVLCLS